MKHANGFSLVELLASLAVVSVLATVAVPSYRSFMTTQRVRSTSYDLMSTLVFARSEAIKRNSSVTVTKAAGGWAQGWTVVSGGTTLRVQDPFRGGVVIKNSAALGSITYSNDGRLASATTDFSISPPSGVKESEARCVRIRLGGMPSAKRGDC